MRLITTTNLTMMISINLEFVLIHKKSEVSIDYAKELQDLQEL